MARYQSVAVIPHSYIIPPITKASSGHGSQALLHFVTFSIKNDQSLNSYHTATFSMQVLSRALMYIPQLGKYAESILENGSSSGRKLAKLQRIARQAVAALCALGGFKETIKIGSEVQVTSQHFRNHCCPQVTAAIDKLITCEVVSSTQLDRDP